jgi:predicted  nucleic acid-binding Zn-ribbon protein
MPHQCVHCGKIYPAGSKELLEGCSNCNSHFFFYIKDEQLQKIKEGKENPIEMPAEEKKQVEKEIREMAGITDEETPVILDIESVRVASPGKFEIDLVNLFNKNRPLVYKLGEGKYIIDLSSTLSRDIKGLKEIKNPDKKGE